MEQGNASRWSLEPSVAGSHAACLLHIGSFPFIFVAFSDLSSRFACFLLKGRLPKHEAVTPRAWTGLRCRADGILVRFTGYRNECAVSDQYHPSIATASPWYQGYTLVSRCTPGAFGSLSVCERVPWKA